MSTIFLIISPDTQPIEVVWAVLKNYVARCFTLGRGIVQLRKDLWNAFETITERTIKGILRQRTIPYLNSMIAGYSELSGTIENLESTSSANDGQNSYPRDCTVD